MGGERVNGSLTNIDAGPVSFSVGVVELNGQSYSVKSVGLNYSVGSPVSITRTTSFTAESIAQIEGLSVSGGAGIVVGAEIVTPIGNQPPYGTMSYGLQAEMVGGHIMYTMVEPAREYSNDPAGGTGKAVLSPGSARAQGYEGRGTNGAMLAGDELNALDAIAETNNHYRNQASLPPEPEGGWQSVWGDLGDDGPSKDPSRPGDLDRANSPGVDPYSGDGIPEGHSVPTASGVYDRGVNDLSPLDQAAAQQQSKYGYVDGKYVELNGRKPDEGSNDIGGPQTGGDEGHDRDDGFDYDNYDPPEPAETTTRDSEGGGGQVHEINHSNGSTTTYTSSNDTYNDDGDLIAGGADIPLLLDLDGNGIQITELSQSTHFVDATGDGLQNRTAWAGAGDAVLFYDPARPGHPNGLNDIVEKSQYVFSEWDPTAASDIEALRAVFDSNGDGVLNASDAAFADFKLMVTNADGSTSVMTLAAAGITEIDLTGDATHIELPDGSVITGQTTFTRSDGSTGTVGDVTLVADGRSYRVVQSASTDGNGERTETSTGYRADGSIGFVMTSVTSADGLGTPDNSLLKCASEWEGRIRSGKPGNFSAGVVIVMIQETKRSITHANGMSYHGRCFPSRQASLG